MTDAMLNPSHPGETIRDSIEEMEWTVTYAAGPTWSTTTRERSQ